jgi:hypothetical protein
MTVQEPDLHHDNGDHEPTAGAQALVDPALVSAVRDDIRQTLRVGWIEPAFDAAAAHPTFFTAVWSAVRPNVGKSFLVLSRAIRAEAAEAARTMADPAELRRTIQQQLSDEEVRRVEDSIRASQLATAKVQIVVHAMYRAARRERISGTGREEAPIRRGIPEWQRWMSSQPVPEDARSILADVAASMGAPVAPPPLRLLARWPTALNELWEEVRPHLASDAWQAVTTRLRRMVLRGMVTLPHPIDMQWSALRARGFDEEDRLAMVASLAEHDGSMPSQTLAAAFAWVAVGSPEIGVEG